METPILTCANNCLPGANCENVGKSACGKCRLVVVGSALKSRSRRKPWTLTHHLVSQYCSPECQKNDWKAHKTWCKSDLGRQYYRPKWVVEDRTPTFVGQMTPIYTGFQELFGDLPAIDLLQLGSNEGMEYPRDLRLLFAASGDLRNVIKTIAKLPKSYNQSVHITMNDSEIDIVARNALLLLIAFTARDPDDTAECMVHIWYSMAIRSSDLEFLQRRAGVPILRVWYLLRNTPDDTVVGTTFTSGKRHLKLTLTKRAWYRLLGFLYIPEGLSLEKANDMRTHTTLSRDRMDFHERHYIFLAPVHRLANLRFRTEGLLLPFGAPRERFSIPNPTFFQDGFWPLHDMADPLAGWSAKDVEATPIGHATSDIYGKLFYHIKYTIKSFLERISNLSLAIRLLNVDARHLPAHLGPERFDRIDVSNLTDRIYLGIRPTLEVMSPLLQSRSVNPHATLLALFANVIVDNMTFEDRVHGVNQQKIAGLARYLVPGGSPGPDTYSP
ncbi:hypothetical protein F53441_12776 [Fusarium austroafricanum]|uniref:MYND-type zinc finger protein samB n=1 Tax=Fusarium austroafricanum TaxID=2364996 RepID=A0A8H4NU94_9HYPO|nr:hypothetical protein F53441_12776 [Fusarium austroafricanum]